jgi:hypothetical protein
MQKHGQVAAVPKSQGRFHALRHAMAVHLLDAGSVGAREYPEHDGGHALHYSQKPAPVDHG